MTVEHLRISQDRKRFDAMIGTGGVGSGMFFAVNGMHTIGREESRSVRIEDRKDYCKLHIVSHYVKSLLGNEFEVIAIGKVGEDDAGSELVREMREAGIATEHMMICSGERTLFSFCFSYPDGSGGNLTTDDSASSKLTPQDVHNAEEPFARFGKRGIGIALPEVPLDTRTALLKLSTAYGLYRIASFTSNEMDEVKKGGILEIIDHLAANMDEAARLASGRSKEDTEERTVNAAVETLLKKNDKVTLSVTDGKNGSWIWDKRKLHRLQAPEVEAVSTAGAGDAFLGGLVAGISAGFGLLEAQQLATLVGSLSVTSPHTIDKRIDREAINNFAHSKGFPVCAALKEVLR